MDNSFINLLKDENFNRIIIDSRLEDSFKRVMQKIQSYFNANGYTSQRDYTDFLEKYLLSDDRTKLQIEANNEPSKIGADGFYWPRREEHQVIYIDESQLKLSNEDLDSTLCHEFIHFLVMRALQHDNSDPQIINGGFINEALTEMLTQQIYPNSNAYVPQVNMMKYANLLTDKVNNYSQFLQGHIDSRGGASAWNSFTGFVKKYHDKMKDKPFIMSEAEVDDDYIQAQRYITQANIHPHLVKQFSEYEKWISALYQRPAPDNEWIENFEIQLDQNLIRNLGVQETKLQEILLNYLKEYRNIDPELSKYDGKDVIEFEIAGQKIAMDENRKLYGIIGYSSSWNPNTSIFKVQVNGETREFNFAELDFSKRRQELIEKKKNIPNYFSKSLSSDIKAMNNVARNDGLIKLERFILPSVASAKSKNNYIYVATYKDRVEVLDSAMQLGNVQNVHSSRYIGLTAKENGAIYANPVGVIERGTVFSSLNKRQLQINATEHLRRRIVTGLTNEQLNSIIEQYRKSSYYNTEDEKDFETLKGFALDYYAKKTFSSLSDQEKNNIINQVIEEHPKYMISSNNGQIEVSLLFGKEYKTAFLGRSETLFDVNSNGLWNEYYSKLRKEPQSLQKEETTNQTFNIDENGNIVDSSKEKEKENETMKSNPQEELIKLNEQMKNLRIQYGTVTTQMESLMKQNQQSPVLNYQQKLDELMKQRDSISQQMELTSSSQRTYQSIIQLEKENDLSNRIAQVEKLLGTRITDTSMYEYDPQLKASRVILKDTDTLSKERGAINKQLEELYHTEKIDLNTYKSMQLAVYHLYEQMSKKAPKPTSPTSSSNPSGGQSEFTQQEELTPFSSKKEETPVHYSEKKDRDDLELEREQMRKKYHYDVMSDSEKEKFDRDLEDALRKRKGQTERTDSKEELEEQRRNLRRKQFEERMQKMGIDRSRFDLDELFRQQQMIEQQRLEESEEIEQHHGMSM